MNKFLKLSSFGIFIIALSLIPNLDAAIIFQDDFNRADGAVGNGWTSINNGFGSDLTIENNQLTNESSNNSTASIYRTVGFTQSINVTASLSETQALDGADDRFESSISILADNTVQSGYRLTFARSSEDFNNSRVYLFDGETSLGHVYSTFQFVDEIHMDFTFNIDGSISGEVTDNFSNSFLFNFGAHNIASSGSNFQITMGTKDNRTASNTINPKIDNLTITAVPEPNSVALLGLGLLGLGLAKRRKA